MVPFAWVSLIKAFLETSTRRNLVWLSGSKCITWPSWVRVTPVLNDHKYITLGKFIILSKTCTFICKMWVTVSILKVCHKISSKSCKGFIILRMNSKSFLLSDRFKLNLEHLLAGWFGMNHSTSKGLTFFIYKRKVMILTLLYRAVVRKK